jgi:ParB-like chromosome segregation protein Spo0J
MLDLKKIRRLPKGADLSHIQPDLRDKAVPVELLSAHPDNPQVHPEANKRAIAGSIKKYLQRKGIVCNQTDKGLRITAGHGVYEAMVAAGAQYVAVTVCADDAVTELGYMIADNRAGELSETDPEKLAPILRQLIEVGEEVEEIGWDEATVRALLDETEEKSEKQPKGDFPEYGEDIETQYRCPKCEYCWSGKPK